MLSNKNLFNGLHYHDALFESAWEDARIRCEHNPNLVAIPDIESGFPIVMTKEERANFIQLWEDCKPKLSPESAGKVLIFGTGGDMEKGNFNDVFYNPENWKVE